MDANTELALSVVAVMVVHHPDEPVGSDGVSRFDDVLRSLAAQDYPNLKTLFLVTGEPGDLATRIRDIVPGAFVRAVPGNPGFGVAANEVMRLVEGDNGFFMILNDDVALEPGATRILVEELYRSNAGIVGPKLVMWDEPRLLQHVGLGIDRFGEVDPLVEPGEVDQEQHDAVRDVFALPSACMLVRADLFKALGGFDPGVDFYGDDVDLCWRAHLSGARVVVVPAARARHREALAARRPDLAHHALAARHRVRTVATLTGGLRLPLVLIQMLLISLLEMVVGLFTGRLGEAFASFRSTVGLVGHVGSIIKRRRQIAPLRHVPYREVAGLQIRGSARLASYLRAREINQMSVDHSAVGSGRFTRNTAGQIGAWVAVIVLAAIGSRAFVGGGVPPVGQFLRFPDSTRALLGDYWSGWWSHGLGRTTGVPTGIGLIGATGIASFGHMGLFHTVAVLGWLPFGYYGAWKLMSIFPSSRARIVGLITFAAIPLPYSALGAGRWSVVAAYGAAPWIVHLLRRIARIEPALTARADADIADASEPIHRREQFRDLAKLTLITAVVSAFAPTFGLIVLVIGVSLTLATIVGRGSLGAAATMVIAAVIAGFVAALINLPWISTLFGANGWDAFVGAPTVGTEGLSLGEVLRFSVGPSSLGVLALALWLPVLAAPLLARGWRLTWAGRGGMLAVVSLLLAMLGQRDALPFRLPEIGLLLVPAVIGIAVSAACAAAAFEQDVQGGSFGWRQPLGLLCGVAVVVGAIPAVAATADGSWSTPSGTLTQPSDQFQHNPADGDSRTLFIGDTRVMPIDGWRFDDAGMTGISYAVVDDGPLTVHETWAGLPSGAERDIAEVLRLIATNATARAGRLLAPYGIRYLVVPLIDGLDSSANSPLPAPSGLLAGLAGQLDFRIQLSPPNYIAYENSAWVPTHSNLSALAAEESKQAGLEALASIQVAGSTPEMIGMDERGPGMGPVLAGVFHVAKPFDSRWTLTVDGVGVPVRPAFGTTMAFDVTSPGNGKLTYTTDTARHVAVIVQALAWLALLVVASRIRWGWLRRRRVAMAPIDGPLLDIGEREPLAAPWIFAPGTRHSDVADHEFGEFGEFDELGEFDVTDQPAEIPDEVIFDDDATVALRRVQPVEPEPSAPMPEPSSSGDLKPTDDDGMST
ncbi:MAG: glycosyltransferase family 2 protein [Ilumatobacteraceae bacterium]